MNFRGQKGHPRVIQEEPPATAIEGITFMGRRPFGRFFSIIAAKNDQEMIESLDDRQKTTLLLVQGDLKVTRNTHPQNYVDHL